MTHHQDPDIAACIQFAINSIQSNDRTTALRWLQKAESLLGPGHCPRTHWITKRVGEIPIGTVIGYACRHWTIEERQPAVAVFTACVLIKSETWIRTIPLDTLVWVEVPLEHCVPMPLNPEQTEYRYVSYPEAEAHMLAGGEAEQHAGVHWYRSRIMDGKREFLGRDGEWGRDPDSIDWHEFSWRIRVQREEPGPRPQTYDWKHAFCRMVSGETWVATHKHWVIPLQFKWAGPFGGLVCRADASDEWSPYRSSIPLTECEWRPESEARA